MTMRQLFTLVLLCICSGAGAQTDTLHWHRLSPYPADARVDFASFLIDSDFYMVGGYDTLGYFRRDVWCYHLATDQWEQKGNLPGGTISSSVGFSLKGKGYIIIGLDSLANYDCDSAFWKYDPVTDIWTRMSDFPGMKRYIATCFQYNNKGFIFGGLSCRRIYQANDLWSYDPDSSNWTQMSSLLDTGRAGATSAVKDSFAYILGGGNGYDQLNQLWCYNILADSWKRLPDYPYNTCYLQPIWATDRFLISGYGRLDASLDFSLSRRIFKYSFIDTIWTEIKCEGYLDSISIGACFSVGHSHYSIGGYRSLRPYLTYTREVFYFNDQELLHSGVEDIANTAPELKVFPQPFKVGETLRIQSSERGSIELYNTLGQQLYNGSLLSGLNVIPAEALSFTSGVFFYRAIYRNGLTSSGKLIVE